MDVTAPMPDRPVTDAELIEQWRRGDEHAATQLVRRHATAVARFLGAGGGGGRVEAEIARLPRLQRELFLLRAQQELGYEEIARALGTTPGAARVHYHHAVKRLKRVAEG